MEVVVHHVILIGYVGNRAEDMACV